MPLSGCSNGLVATALIALLLLPAHYYIPEAPGPREPQPGPEPRLPTPKNATQHWLPVDLPPLDLFLTISLLLLAMLTYLFDWIQRKLMERRILKLKLYLVECVDRLKGWDARQGQLEGTLRMVQNATAEYNLLLYLLLRRHRLAPAPRRRCCDKDPDHLDHLDHLDRLDRLDHLDYITNMNTDDALDA